MKVETINVIPLSGGKDSQAVAEIAHQEGVENILHCFADTGIESQITYDHLDYLEQAFGQKITRLKRSFAAEIENKRAYIEFVWRAEGVSDAVCERALSVLKPTGVPFLDLCLIKGRFPGHASAEFCSIELKQKTMEDHQHYLFRQCAKNLICWQGTRRDESARRAHLTEWEADIGDIEKRTGKLVYRPIVHWNESQVFEFLAKSGKNINPLYEKGFKRVGCFPCKNEVKNSVRLIADLYPEHIEMVAEMEKAVSEASKHGVSTFFDARVTAAFLKDELIAVDTHGVNAYVEWSRSKKNGRGWQKTLFAENNQCSVLGYCE